MATDVARAAVGVLVVVLFGVACGGSSTPAAATSHAATPSVAASNQASAAYVAMVEAYWHGIVAADGVSGGVNAASRACLGTKTDSAPADATLVEPAACAKRVVLILAVQQKFIAEIYAGTAPAQYANDDKIFRTDVPFAIDALQALLSATATGSKRATYDASNTYADIMLSTVVGALDDVDPSTEHY